MSQGVVVRDHRELGTFFKHVASLVLHGFADSKSFYILRVRVRVTTLCDVHFLHLTSKPVEDLFHDL
jgi:hypothetical protein